MSLARLLCELEIDHALEEFLRDRGLTLESDRQLLDELRALKGETFVEIAERVLGFTNTAPPRRFTDEAHRF